MILSAVCGLPLGLGEAGKALCLGQDEAKDKSGKALIRYFCSPCKPTKVNGGRTRNRPADAPEKWAQFIEYNRQDVVSERAIRSLLLRWNLDETEQRFWCLDARINENGTLTAIILALVALVYQVLGLFGVVPKISQDELTTVIGMVINLLCLLGIVVDPTTDGVSDSARALTYDTPRADK